VAALVWRGVSAADLVKGHENLLSRFPGGKPEIDKSRRRKWRAV
jgi:hypothetical protein